MTFLSAISFDTAIYLATAFAAPVGSSGVESLSAFFAYTSYKHSETSFTSLSPRSSRCLVGSSGVEPPTSCLSGMRSNLLSYEPILELPVGFLHLSSGGDEGIRTLDPLLAGQVLSQLSYTPVPLYFRSPGLFPLLGSLFSLRFSSSSRAMKTEQQAFIPDSVLLLFFCRDSFFSISTSESSTVVMIRVSLERR